MPKYMLDTNMCIYLMKNQPASVAARFAECYFGDVVISAVTLAELQYGVACSVNKEQDQRSLALLLEDVPAIPFDIPAAAMYGMIRYANKDKKSDALDKLIAAHAVALKVVLVTNNERDFKSYPGLVLDNWIEAH
ncbi:MAG: type II toxin-antitoxin system VapC family toxin [Sulfuriferula sp.]|nr:type II toxin-antitoxin system VapC family toxin [Sulfuriferula sp.]